MVKKKNCNLTAENLTNRFIETYNCKLCTKFSEGKWGNEAKKICAECLMNHQLAYHKNFDKEEISFDDYIQGVLLAEKLVKEE